MKQQQNNMSQSLHPHSPTYQHQQLFSKNNKLYQQLLQDDLISEDQFKPTKFISNQPAHIKFNQPICSPVKISRENDYINERQDFSPKLPKSGLFKVFEPSVGRISIHATQSLSSNYCITEHQNEQNSTVNLYSLSKNHIEPDISHNITAKLDEDNELESDQQTIKNDNKILEASILNNSLHRQSSQLQYQRIKKYRSEQYAHTVQEITQENQEQSKIPKVLAEKYLKNDFTRKFSSQNSQHDSQSNFKTVLNQVHVVPYKINNQIKPYTFSIPIQNKQYTYTHNNIVAQSIQNDKRKTVKANSLNLKNSQHSLQQNEEEITTIPARHLYFSNHTHANLQSQNRATTHFTQAQSQPKLRQAPKSEPKYNHKSDKNNRSNSIQCKNKPIISPRQNYNQNQIKNIQPLKQNLQQSHVTKIFKNYSQPSEYLGNQTSVIYQSTGINICCSLTSDNKKIQHHANKINFMSKPKQEVKYKNELNTSPFFCSSIDMTKVSPFSNPKKQYKINPIQMIRQLNENQQSRGIKLIGFPRKDNKL